MDSPAVAFCPGHISGYFRRVEGETLSGTGSLGAGIVIEEGVRAQAFPADEVSVIIRRTDPGGAIIEERAGSPPIEYALESLGVCAEIETCCHLPIGAGFGLSAAALLASIAAVSALWHLRLTARGIAKLAHEAEIVHKTGLGDVAACQGGGLACRTGPGIDAPIIRRIEPAERISAVSFGPLRTPDILTDNGIMARIASAFPERCPESVPEFFSLSRSFADKTGLVSPEIEEVLSACDRASVPASMTMLGNGVFAYGRTAQDVLSGFGETWSMSIAKTGFRLEVDKT